MKKVLNFLRSMTFGVILLALVCGISVIGSLIEQDQEAMYYVTNYSSWYQILLILQFDHIFSSWYFDIVVLLLCINLTLCTIVRFGRITSSVSEDTAALGRADVHLDAEGVELAKKAMVKQHCRVDERNGRTIYRKNDFGKYGTFITHLGILLTVVFFTCALQMPVVTDQTCMPGDSIVMDDGTEIAVESFQIEDETGTLDYASQINVTLPNGKSSGVKETSVNHPVSFGEYKIYQQTYGTIGIITVTDDEGHSDRIVMEDQMFLSKDGVTGILYNTLYPDFVQGEDGSYSLVTSTSGRYENPVYTFDEVIYADEEQQNLQMTPMLAFPGDEITIDGLTYHFETPVEYPGLRIKYCPSWVNILLVISFVIMILGFAVTFLMTPVLVVITEDGYRVMGSHPEGMKLMLKGAVKGHVQELKQEETKNA